MQRANCVKSSILKNPLSFLYAIVGPNAIAKKALLNEIRTLKQAGKHPNIITLVGTRKEGGKSVLDKATSLVIGM